MKKKYVVTLTDEERQTLKDMISTGKTVAAKTLIRARILLKADVSDGRPRRIDEEVAAEVEVGRATVERVRKLFVEEGFEAALTRRKSRRVYTRKLDGDGEAHLVALSCQTPPDGYARWSLRLLADKVVALEMVDSISYVAVRNVLKKRNQALAERAVLHSARRQRGVRLQDGRRTGGL